MSLRERELNAAITAEQLAKHRDGVTVSNERMPSGDTPYTVGNSFSYALDALRAGKRVARLGWNGRDMFLYYVGGSEFRINREPLKSIFGEGTLMRYHGHIDMYTAQGTCVPWIASQTDLLTDDWVEVIPKTIHQVQPLR